MAERFGGTYSPGAERGTGRGWDGRRRVRSAARLNALYVAPVPIALAGFFQGPLGLASHLVAFATLIGAAQLTKHGLRAEDAFDQRATARRPALPRKILGAGLTGAGLALAGLPDVGAAVIFGLLGTGLHLAAFGLDPLRDKQVEGADSLQSDRVARAVEEGEAYLAEMRAAIARTGDGQLETRVASFVDTARRLFRSVEADPRDLPGARRWLGVYLLGARDATVKYAAIAARREDPAARGDFVAFLDDLEQGFAARTERLLLEDRSEMDLEIDVLRDRMAREGVLVDRATTNDGDEGNG